MNILLIYPQPDVVKPSRFGFSYELLLLATILSKYHNIVIHDYSCELYLEESFKHELDENEYDLVIVECDSFALKRSQNLKHAREILSLIKGTISSIAFGHYCCISKRDFVPADFTVKINNLNLILERINYICRNSVVPLIFKYDDLPYIERNLLLKIDYFERYKKNTLLQTSKGCQNSCIFCQRRGWQKRYVAHSDEYVLKELFQLYDKGFSNIWIIDENFTFDLLRAKRLLSKYNEFRLKYKPNLFISSWANIDNEFIDLAFESNIRIISFGVESGNMDILRYYKKNIDLKHIPKIIRYANSRGIFTVGNFIIGAPMETESTIEETFSLIRHCNFDQVNIKTLDYMMGSELHNTLPENLKGLDHVFSCAEYNLCDFPLAILAQKKNDFLESYYVDRKDYIRQKIKQYGFPYAPQ